jgi:predicted MPP superfamily phosphohydrolase
MPRRSPCRLITRLCQNKMARRQSIFIPRRRKKRYGCLTVALLFLFSLGMVVGINSLANRFVKLEIQAITLPELPRKLEGFTILHLSDLNAATLGKDHEHLKKVLALESYQAVCLTGDMVGKTGDAGPLLALLDIFGGKVPVFLIAGGGDPAPLLSDPHGDSEVLAPYIRQAQAKGAVYLSKPQLLEIEGERLWFCPADMFELDLDSARRAYSDRIASLKGAENPYSPENGAQLRLAEYQLKMVEIAISAKAHMKAGDTAIALRYHAPDPALLSALRQDAQRTGAILPQVYLSGQFNGGQIRLPFLGPVYIPPQGDGRGGWLPGDAGFTGLEVYKGQAVYISPGLGVSSYYPLPLRLFNRPTATLIRLTRKLGQ